jgi:hypothetical protein
MLDDIALLVVLFVALVLYYLLSKSDLISYYIDTNVSLDFAWEAHNILLASNVNKTHKIGPADSKNQSDIEIYLVPRKDMIKMRTKPDEYYPGTNKKIYFSWTYLKPKPIIYIDEDNWLYGIPESGLSLSDYRKYVIQHEFMHALGYDHQPCNVETAINGVCPIMFQSTRGCPKGFACGKEITPVDYKKLLT